MLTDLARQSLAALRLLIVLTVVLGIGYPLAVYAAGRAFGDHADGQPLHHDGMVVGSRLLGQNFEGDQWFHSRPSTNNYDTLASAVAGAVIVISVASRSTEEAITPSAAK